MSTPRYRRIFRLPSFGDRRAREEMSEEIRFHVEVRAEAFRRSGMSAEEALAEATRRFGPPEAARSLEASAAHRSARLRLRDWRDALAMDARFALRGMRRAPMFTSAAILTLALGIGANVAIFGVVRGVLLTPLPYGQPDRAVVIWNHWPGWPRVWLSQPEVYDYARDTGAFAASAAFTNAAYNITGKGADPERVNVGLIQGSLLAVAGVRPLAGRDFSPAEDSQNGPRAAMLLEGYWRRRFGADPAIIGRSIVLNNRSYVVVAILPGTFRLPSEFSGDHAEIFLPLQLGPPDNALRGSHRYNAMARLAPGVTIAQAQQRLNAAVTSMMVPGTPYGPAFGATVFPLSDEVRGEVRPALYLLLGAVSFVLLIACANVASLLIARTESRAHEISIRSAIGAGRTRIIVQFLTESIVLAAGGGALGLVLASVIIRALTAVKLDNVPRVDAIHLDAGLVAYAAVLALSTGVILGLAPMARLASDAAPRGSLRQGRRAVGGRSGLRPLLISIELALAVIALTGAGLMVRSFSRLSSVSPGFSADHVMTLSLSPPAAKYPTSSSVTAFYATLLDEIRAIPDVSSAGASAGLPLSAKLGDWAFSIDGEPPRLPNEHPPTADWQPVTNGYLEAIRLPVRRGRAFSERDRLDAVPVALINESLEQKYFPGSAALGKSIRLGGEADTAHRTIVGVVGDVRFDALDEPPRPTIYVPYAQSYSSTPDSEGAVPRSLGLVIRTQSDPNAIVTSVRRIVNVHDADIPLSRVRTMREIVDQSMSTRRFTAMLLMAFGCIALVLAALGVYAVTSQAVAQRTAEIGVRIALGARSSQVVRLIIWQGMVPVLYGLIAGVLIAVAGARVMRSMLYSVAETDAVSFAFAVFTLLAVALLANWRPARRAAAVDPVEALRAD